MFFKRVISLLFAILACIISLINDHGRLRLDKQYLRLIMYDPKFHTIGYLYLSLAFTKNHKIMFVPLILTAFLETGEFIIRKIDNIRNGNDNGLLAAV